MTYVAAHGGNRRRGTCEHGVHFRALADHNRRPCRHGRSARAEPTSAADVTYAAPDCGTRRSDAGARYARCGGAPGPGVRSQSRRGSLTVRLVSLPIDASTPTVRARPGRPASAGATIVYSRQTPGSANPHFRTGTPCVGRSSLHVPRAFVTRGAGHGGRLRQQKASLHWPVQLASTTRRGLAIASACGSLQI